MKYKNFKYGVATGVAVICVLFSSCNKDVLDRPPIDEFVDNNFWRSEDDLRLHANGYYTNYFVGFNSTFGAEYTPVRGYTFNDDLTSSNVQSAFESSVPASRSGTTIDYDWMSQYAGPTWNFAWVRKANTFIDRIENVAKPKISTEAYNHWTAVARFFRGYEYSRLVSVFGDVPYFGRVVQDTEFSELYKDRDNRGVVMDKVYDDFKFVLANMRLNDGTNNLNRYIAAAFISRFMLFEGTFQKYHNLDAARSKKYLEFAVEAAEIVMNSNKYNFTSDYKSLFASESLTSNPEVIMYRIYDAALTITHAITSYQNGTEIVGFDGNLVLIKSFLANDGKVFQNSTVPNATSFAIADLVKTRDPRFEATFYDKALTTSQTLLYGFKFAPREALTFIGKTYPPSYGSATNTSDAPVIRLAEVVLNWIEAKAVLEEVGGAAITQADLNKSINAIRNRPLDAAAIAKGVLKTAPLTLAALPVDPARDADVSSLIWEIRRERRMEFVFEHTRLLDLKRWKKLNYMNFSSNPDYLLGPFVNLPVEAPSKLGATFINKTKVKDANGNIITYNGTNASAMVGFWVVENGANRNAFTDKSYLAPVGQAQIIQYQEKGYKLTQTTGW